MSMSSKYLYMMRAKAIEWARDLVREGFIVFDTETTGLGQSDEIIQLAIVGSDGFSYSERFLPQMPISPQAQAIHGISIEALEAQSTRWATASCMVASAFEAYPVVAYNMAFDWRMVVQTCHRYDVAVPLPKARHCAMEMFAQWNGQYNFKTKGFRWVKLAQACDLLHLAPASYHDATEDARQTVALIRALAAQRP